ncbi:hypothetical protein BAE46_00965 [Glaciecola punicea]|jgi:hypothetical protein|uniref:hypothetical protein n=1 Tax=Glaciecola punicea TaxID=56804 RepID=UPI0008720198|nr:hypothetical protein [Glaciecola punicea]OFA33313.1 hypothetical protein BAE46_00965 [Glaciecola punicea]
MQLTQYKQFLNNLLWDYQDLPLTEFIKHEQKMNQARQISKVSSMHETLFLNTYYESKETQ